MFESHSPILSKEETLRKGKESEEAHGNMQVCREKVHEGICFM